MLETDLTKLNVEKSRAVAEHLRALGYQDRDMLGHLGADLGDLYASAIHYQDLLDAWLQAPASERERLGDLLSDLYAEMRHMHAHLESSLGSVDELAANFD